MDLGKGEVGRNYFSVLVPAVNNWPFTEQRPTANFLRNLVHLLRMRPHLQMQLSLCWLSIKYNTV